MEHSPHPHLIDLGYSERQCIIGLDAPRARLIVDHCPACGAVTLEPYPESLIALMEKEWGQRPRLDQDIRDRVMAMTYDPAAVVAL
jgi:hypothetical protein